MSARCIDPADPPLYEGDEIEVPDTAGVLLCRKCAAPFRKPKYKVLGRCVPGPGMFLELHCHRCGKTTKFSA